MARADLILNLVRSGAQGDQAQFHRAVEALAADERAKNHSIFADRLISRLKAEQNGYHRLPPRTTTLSQAGTLVVEQSPERRLQDMILTKGVLQNVQELVEEQYRSDLLRAYNLEPRSRVLLVGPPGNGKTTLAEVIANELNVPLAVVRYEAVIGSYLGETAQRINTVFEQARSYRCVLFFDEFDSIGKERGDSQETGEIKRVVSSLLLQIDKLPSYVVIVAASNHPELLDRAVWRRFQMHLELPKPERSEIEEWLKYFERKTNYNFGVTAQSLSHKLEGLSFSEIEDFGKNIIRKHILSNTNNKISKIVEMELLRKKNNFDYFNLNK